SDSFPAPAPPDDATLGRPAAVRTAGDSVPCPRAGRSGRSPSKSKRPGEGRAAALVVGEWAPLPRPGEKRGASPRPPGLPECPGAAATARIPATGRTAFA